MLMTIIHAHGRRGEFPPTQAENYPPGGKFLYYRPPQARFRRIFGGAFYPPSILPPAEVLGPHQGLEKLTPHPPGKKLGPLKISGSLGMYDDNGIL